MTYYPWIQKKNSCRVKKKKYEEKTESAAGVFTLEKHNDW